MGSSRGRGRPPKKVTQTLRTNHGDDATTVVTTPMISTVNIDEVKSVTEEKGEATTGSAETLENPKLAESSTTKETEVKNKLWVDVIGGNRNAMNVEIEEKDGESEKRFWENVLIMYVIGANLSMNAVKNYMMKAWNFVTLPEMYYNDEGFFILKFKNGEDIDTVLMKGPYTIQNKPMIILEWSHDFSMAKDMLRSIPIWIKLPNLLLPLWRVNSLGKIGSAVENPLFTDECTARKLRVSYARILVEVDVTQKLCEEVTIKDHEGRIRQQKIEYEWRPQYCERC
ncbi:uncharacterized protein LOC131648371 [Vicia villosa]|uniref:uncharacterized protein LOC131648371 n=1 Tax=Vicia villosa TaxID=3911 RepID=UPI00273B95BA|nr:uncharacterized protein LOC131648371 [Vicia villosa]